MSQNFFRIFPEKPNFPFVKYANVFFGISIIFLGICLWALFTKGLNYGVDFQGGSEVYVRFKSPTTVNDIRAALEPVGYSEAGVQTFGDGTKNEFIIRVPSEDLKLSTHQTEWQKALDTLSPNAKLSFTEERLYVTYDSPQDPSKIQQVMQSVNTQNIRVESVTKYGRASDNEYLVQFAGAGARIIEALEKKYEKTNFEILQTEEVGEKVGGELRTQALGAVLISIILILLYIWFRFDFEYAPGAILALIHDAMAILGIFSIMRLQFDLSTIAAVLTIVGFSINDTIVTYDRIRENKKKLTGSFSELINVSINETLGRTILTSLTLFIACVILYFYGGPITQNFAFALCVGILSGTYSTVFIASPMTIYIHRYMQKKTAK